MQKIFLQRILLALCYSFSRRMIEVIQMFLVQSGHHYKTSLRFHGFLWGWLVCREIACALWQYNFVCRTNIELIPPCGVETGLNRRAQAISRHTDNSGQIWSSKLCGISKFPWLNQEHLTKLPKDRLGVTYLIFFRARFCWRPFDFRRNPLCKRQSI